MILTLISPSDGSTIAQATTIVFEIDLEVTPLENVRVDLAFADGRSEEVFALGAFAPLYSGSSFYLNDGPYRFEVSRVGGFDAPFTISVTDT